MSEEKAVGSLPSTLPVSGDLGQLVAEPVTEAITPAASAPIPAHATENDYLPSFLAQTHSYVTQHIQGADQKAIFLFSAAAALLAFLHQDGASELWLKPLNDWGLIEAVTSAAMVSLALAAIAAVGVVTPRLPSPQKGLVSFLGIAAYHSEREYTADLNRAPRTALLAEKASHCHTLAKVCAVKYRLLRVAVIFETIGIIGAVVYFLFVRGGGAS